MSEDDTAMPPGAGLIPTPVTLTPEVNLRDYIDVLLNERRHAEEVAERERVRAANTLADRLAQSISEGDDRLREHITNQFEQVAAALASAEKLEISRLEAIRNEIVKIDQRISDSISAEETADTQLRTSINKLADLQEQKFALAFENSQTTLESMRREFALVNDASEKAIEKAEAANEKRFDGVAEFRVELADQFKDLMPREVAESQINELRKQVQALAEQVGKIT